MRKSVFNILLVLLFTAALLNAAPLTEPEIGETFIFNKYNEGFFAGYSKVSATLQVKGEKILVFTEDAMVNDICLRSSAGGDTLYAATTTGVMNSADMGQTWTFISDVFYELDGTADWFAEESGPSGENFISALPGDELILTGTQYHLYWSKDGGVSWKKITSGLPREVPYYKVVYDTTLGSEEKDVRKFLATDGGLYFNAKKAAQKWEDLNRGMPLVPPYPAPAYDMVLIPDTELYVASEFGPFKGWVGEDDESFSWEPIMKAMLTFEAVRTDTADLMELKVDAEYPEFTVAKNSHIYVVDAASGARWAVSPESNDAGDLIVTIDEESVYFEGTFDGDYTTINPADISMMISTGPRITQIERAADGTLFVVSETGVIKISNGVSTGFGLDTLTINTLLLDGNDLLAGTNAGLYRSGLNSPEWTKMSAQLDDGYGTDPQNYDVRTIVKMPDGSYMLGCHVGGVVQGNASGWTQRTMGLTFRNSSAENLQRIVHSFDAEGTGIYDRLTNYFGPVTDVDGLDKINLLVTDMMDFYFLAAGNGVDYKYSVFDTTDLKLKSENSNSNQRDLIYLDNLPVNLSEYNEAEASITHALLRMILYNQDPVEDEWLAEGLAMWARWVCGYKFYNNPDETYTDLTNFSPVGRNSLLRWGDFLQAGNVILRSDRETSFAFFAYIYEHYLKDSTQVLALMQDPDDGWQSVEKHLGGKTFREVYTDWGLALYFDVLGDSYENGKYAFSDIQITPKSAKLDWGLIAAPPYKYEFPGWSYFYFTSEGWSGTLNKSPGMDSAYVFNGDDMSKYEIIMIEHNDVLDANAKVTRIPLNKFNRGVYVPDFKTTADDPDLYTQIAFLVISNEPVDIAGGAITLANDVDAPSRTSFYPLQNNMLESYYNVYAFSSERMYVDGGLAQLISEGDEGPEVLAINGADTVKLDLEGSYTNETNIFMYQGFLDLSTLMTGESGSINFVENGEDIAGNRVSLTKGPMLYKKVPAGADVTLTDHSSNMKISVSNGLGRTTMMTLFTMEKKESVNLEKGVPEEQISDTYIIGPNGRLVDNAALTISYADMNFTGDESKLGVYQKVGEEWKYVESRVDRKNQTVVAEINELGQYRLQVGDVTSELVALIPSRYDLKQNFPNPFNPETTIKYQIPEDTHVILEVYNLLGQKVLTLVDAFQKAGFHEYRLNMDITSSRLSTGVYVYTIQAGTYRSTRKMILMK